MTADYEKHLQTTSAAEVARALRTGGAVADVVHLHMSADCARWLAREIDAGLAAGAAEARHLALLADAQVMLQRADRAVRGAFWCLALGAGLAVAGGVLALRGWGVV